MGSAAAAMFSVGGRHAIRYAYLNFSARKRTSSGGRCASTKSEEMSVLRKAPMIQRAAWCHMISRECSEDLVNLNR